MLATEKNSKPQKVQVRSNSVDYSGSSRTGTVHSAQFVGGGGQEKKLMKSKALSANTLLRKSKKNSTDR